MSFCHGKGNQETDGCCWVNGAPCPLRWKIVGGRIKEGPELTDRGTVAEYAATVSNNKQIQQRIVDQTQGLNIACRAAVEVIVANPALLNDRAAFDQAWNTHSEYVAQVRPHWRQVEINLGLAEGAYQCSTWVGTGRNECCFSEDEATNTARRSNLASSAVTIRSKRSV